MPLLFRKKYSDIKVKRKEIPEGLWTKCESCGQLIYTKVFIENMSVCPKCNYLHTVGAIERIDQLIDPGTFVEINKLLTSLDPLDFKGARPYSEKISDSQKNTGLKEAAITGEGKIGGHSVVLGVTDSRFIMGSMGSVVGEKITRAIEYAIERRYPVIIVSGSGGGARMEEGCLSLMQMAKTSAALARLSDAGLLFISILTNPTMGGVLASFASLGDILIAEPGALIGFAGPRVIKQTIRQDLPSGFQKPDFLLKHGLIDMIVERKQIKSTLASLLELLVYRGN
jgi:acetyl-CoA carboxylase carboxyl transferase subunit beta